MSFHFFLLVNIRIKYCMFSIYYLQLNHTPIDTIWYSQSSKQEIVMDRTFRNAHHHHQYYYRFYENGQNRNIRV